ncbi:hotdog domain-containing protein [Rugosimonospora acidiphila]|uniref:Hotdog domain-containing protein n=1 Tax=Rugosimonospora acidiphila TaxID=556531 RepID=A0ABP9RR81_9ACTN
MNSENTTAALPGAASLEKDLSPTPPLINHGRLIPIQIYYDDLDAMGMLHHARYATVFERAILDYWAGRGYVPAGDDRSPDLFSAVRELAIEYHVPVTAPGLLLVHLWLNRLGRTSAEFGFRLLTVDGSTVHAEGRRVIIKLDPGTLRPTAWSARILADAVELQAAPYERN